MFALTQTGQEAFYVLIAMAVVSGLLLLRSYRRLKVTARREGSAPRPVRPDAGHHLDAPAEMRRWEVLLEDLGRDLSARLDSKMSALEYLIRLAGEEADRLQRAIEAAHSADGGFKSLSPSVPGPGADQNAANPPGGVSTERATAERAAAEEPIYKPVEPRRAVTEPATRPDPPQESKERILSSDATVEFWPSSGFQNEETVRTSTSRQLGGESEPAGARHRPAAAQPTAAPTATASFSKLRQQQICALADSGLDSEAIAQRIGSTRGEVELILRLRQD